MNYEEGKSKMLQKAAEVGKSVSERYKRSILAESLGEILRSPNRAKQSKSHPIEILGAAEQVVDAAERFRFVSAGEREQLTTEQVSRLLCVVLCVSLPLPVEFQAELIKAINDIPDRPDPDQPTEFKNPLPLS